MQHNNSSPDGLLFLFECQCIRYKGRLGFWEGQLGRNKVGAVKRGVRDWSVITGRGGATKREGGGGHVKFYPYKKGGGAGKVLAMLKGGHKKFWGRFYMVA